MAERSGDAVADFSRWAEAFADTGNPDLIEEGMRLARERRGPFKALIRDDPREAIRQAIPMLVRQKLPPEVVALLERRIAARGVMRVYQSGPESVGQGERSQLRYVETVTGETFEAHVFGRRAASVEWVPNLSAIGVSMDEQLALDERPLRVMEPGEIPPEDLSQVSVCPVSKKTTATEPKGVPITTETPAVIANGEVVYLCDGSHTEVYERMLVQGESSSGGALSFTGILPSVPTPSVGVVKVLFIPAIFTDQNETPITEAGAYDMMRQSADFYQANSYGRLTLVATVTPPVRLPHNRAWYVGKDSVGGFIKEIDGLGLEMTHAKEAARRAGYDWQDFHATVVRANGGARSPTSYGGGGNVWMRVDSVSTATHEIGHAFGLAHANFWETNGASVIGPGGNVEYGNNYDNMGGASPPNGHYNAQAKNQVRWMPDEFAPPITSSGTYRFYRLDQTALEPGKRYALRIRKDNDRTYWGEYRLLGGNNWANNGLLLGWKWPIGGGSNIQLLDTTAGSLNGKLDAGITLGRTFSDLENGIHLTTLSVNNTTPASVDVAVNFGTFPANRSPVLQLSPATTVVPVNASVTFTATASDPDGDDLAYSWQWHDSVISGNGPTATRVFSTAGVYTLSCVVSDLKGGLAVRNAVITVGNGNSRFTISGRITRNGQGLPNISVGTGGANGTLTDSDGGYTISNLAAGNYSVAPALHGWVFNELFNNSITVGPSFSGADFTADNLPTISIEATGPVAVEGGSAGSFRLTRTGSDAVPQTVLLFAPLGTATKGTTTTGDYSLTPDLVLASSFQTFTIPAGSSSLDVAVAARNDGVSEGYETVTLLLANDTSYVLGSKNTATVAIEDANSALPRVSLSAVEAQTTESGSPVSVTVTRTGSVAAALTVPYAVATTSTARAGADYTTLPGSITIPVGATSASFVIAPIDDPAPEPTEGVSLSISSGAAFFADAGANAVSVRLLDDDTQTVNVTAVDATATEVDRAGVAAPDPGTFLVSRTGSTAAPLTVYYSVAGTALHGVDYDALPGSVVIPAGRSQSVITIMPRLDNFGEGAETVILALGGGFGSYQPGTSGSATVTLNDASTDKPLLQVTAYSAIAAEPSTHGTFRITARGGPAGSLTAKYSITGTATAGSDFSLTGLNSVTLTGTTTLTLTGGTVTSNLTFTVINDALLEEMENVTLTLTPDPNYALWDPLASATMSLRDDDQPTVFVDGQVGNGGSDFISESSTSTTLKFFVSRTGSTAAPLTVNYTLGGAATAGSDYTSTNLTGSVVIPAGVSGVDVNFNTISDTGFEGTESVTLQLAPGGYARGGNGTIWITDDDAGTQSVAFEAPGGSGVESLTSVAIPVSLSAPASVPVSVEYSLESGPRNTTFLQGTWVRIQRTGNSFATSTSPDGVAWTSQSSTRTLVMSSASYLAGIFLTSGSTTASASATIDAVSVDGLSAGGSVGAMVADEIGASLPKGASQVRGGIHQLSAGGPDVSTASADGCRFVYFPITNSVNCTITARVLDLTGSSTSKVGVMIRESTAAGALRMAFHTSTASISQSYRTATNAAASNATGTIPNLAKPTWLRLARVGNDFTASTSADGVAFTPVGGAQRLALSAQVLVGMAVSSRSDGTLAQGTFDQVNLSPSPSSTFQDRSVGFLDPQGFSTSNAGVFVVSGAGTGFLPSATSTEDEGHFLSVPVVGDFTVTARVTAISTSTAQAGLMVRENLNYRAHSVSFCLTGTGAGPVEWRARLSATQSGEGNGVDCTLPPGVLNFAVGEQTKNILLGIADDSVSEPMEFVNVLLRNPTAAILGGGSSSFTYAIVDNDAITAQPVVGFAAAASSGLETAAAVQVPIVLSEPAAGLVTVDYSMNSATAADGVDFTATAGTLSFPAGETLAYVPVTLLDDSVVEPGETFTIALSNPSAAVLGTTSVHTFTILDDDTPLVSILASDSTATEGGDGGAFTVTRTGPVADALTVNFNRSGSAVSGTDYTAIAAAGSVTIPVGQASAEIVVSPLQDTTAEGPETVIITLTNGSGYAIGAPGSATVTLNDDDVNTVSLVAVDASASETPGNGGQFQLTRSGPATAALSVNLSLSGTATSGSDYSAISTSQTFAIGVTVLTIPLNVVQDSLTEGSEVVVASLNSSSSYLLGDSSVASITITDDDLPPTVFISSPASKSTIVNSANGLLLSATASDDGLPSPLTHAWTQLFGPGVASFGSPDAASTTATFSAPGVYGLRVTVNDGQFTASDEIFVQNGGFNYANWVTQDQGPPTTRGIAGESAGTFVLIGSGSGYTGTNDSGHMLFRQLFTAAGNATVVARLTSLNGPGTRLAGLTLRDTSWKGGKRVNLLFDANGTVQFRQRTTPNAVDSASTTSGSSLPLWLKLERVGGILTASHAPDVSGAPGDWVTDGTSSVTLNNNLIVGMVVSAGANTTATATAIFDNLTVTPQVSGPALHSEDLGNSPLAGSSTETGGTVTVTAYGTHDASGGHFRYQQIWGDCILTAQLTNHNGSFRGAQSGISLRDSTDNVAYAFYGNTSVDGYQVQWRSTPGGSGGTLQSSGTGFIRLIRKGNTVNAYKASSLAGPWSLNSGNLPVVLTGPLLVGLVVDSSSNTTAATGTFANFSVKPLNTAPVVDVGTLAAVAPFLLNATISDDGQPSPPAAITSQWSKLNGPGTVTFANPLLEDTLAAISANGTYGLRLTADDGDTTTFQDLSFTGYTSPFSHWLATAGIGDPGNDAAETFADPDQDGLLNLLEYASGTDALAADASPQVISFVTVGPDRFLRLSIPKNPAATDVSFTVETSSDLVNWSSTGLVIEVNTATQLVVRDHLPMSSGPRRFIRVRVSR
ncbi:MAG: Calx-beta domain-containing protein/PKD domain-containing protein [Verrucomicrobia bacterium]|nr:MAG: Calx-beta domain-containing protein/PKD domain-containing protein [Verrucomicrobiota bacterium]